MQKLHAASAIGPYSSLKTALVDSISSLLLVQLVYHLSCNVSAACIQDIISTKLCHEFIWKVLGYPRVFGVQVNFRS